MTQKPVLDWLKLVKTKTEKDQSKAVQSSLLRFWDIYIPVLVSVFPKIGKRPNWTGLSSTNLYNEDLIKNKFKQL